MEKTRLEAREEELRRLEIIYAEKTAELDSLESLKDEEVLEQ